MQYLIDGHNLIAQLDDISLSDPDDEIKLILKLRRWTAARKKRNVTVYFDGGIPGGKNVNLSNSQVKVIFASMGKTADALLMRRIDQVRNPAEYILVSSDQQIIAAARQRKMKYWRSQKFAMRLDKQIEERQQPKVIDPQSDPVLTKDELQEWLDLFGPVDENALKAQIEARRRRRKEAAPPPPEEPETPAPPPPPASTDRENPELSDAELEEWLTLFGGEPTQKPAEKSADKSGKPAPPARKKRKSKPKPDNPQNLRQEDLDAWRAFAERDD